MDQVTRIALERVERNGIVFLDEIDKIAGREGGHGPDVSREGVQRDILPIVEGTTVNTRYGFVRTDHILVHRGRRISCLETQRSDPRTAGPLPYSRGAEIAHGSRTSFAFLKEPKNALVKQYDALLDTEGIKLTFTDDASIEIARIRRPGQSDRRRISARGRLHTIMEKLLEDISFDGPDLKKKNVKIDAVYVRKQLADIVKDQDLSRYIL